MKIRNNEISPQTPQDGYYPKNKMTSVGQDVGKSDSFALLMGLKSGATMENSMEVP